MTRFFVSGLLITYPINFEFLVRMGYIDHGLFANLRFSVIFLLSLLIIASLNYRRTFHGLSDVPYGNVIIAYVLIVTALGYVCVKSTGFVVPFSIESRVVTQLLAFLSSVAAALIVTRYLINFPYLVMKWLFAGLAFMLLAALGQIVLQGMSGVIGNRLFGLAGEPKGLGLYLVPFFVAFLFSSGYKWRWLASFVIFAFIALTFSASALLAVIVSATAVLWTHGLLRMRYLVGIAVLSLVVVFIMLEGGILKQLLIDRIFLRVTNVGDYNEAILAVVDFPLVGGILVEGSEAPVFRLLVDYPIFILTGLGYGMQTIFAFPYQLAYESGFLNANYEGYITPNLGLLNNTTNYGLVMTGIMLFTVLKQFKRIKVAGLSRQHEFLCLFLFSSFISHVIIYEIHLKVVFFYFLLTTFFRFIEKYERFEQSGIELNSFLQKK